MLNTKIFSKYYQSASWYRPDLKVLVACSGGVDSTVLLHLLSQLPDIQITIVHFDHQLRGADSKKDKLFVGQLGQSLGYDVQVVTENIGIYAMEHSMSVEEAGSVRRRHHFLALRDKLDVDFVATGQHEDDQIETILLNLYQGTGIQGLRGTSGFNNGFIRPLLHFSREEIVNYATDHRLKYREDQSNTDISFLRNNIRVNIIPKLIQSNDLELRVCIKAIIQAAKSLDGMVETSIEAVDIKEFNTYYAPKIALGMGKVPGYFSPIQKAIFDRAFQFISLMPQGISSSHFTALKSLFGDEAIGKEIQLPALVSACRNREGITLYKKTDHQWSQTQISLIAANKFPFFMIEQTSSIIADHVQDPSYFWYHRKPEVYTLRAAKSGDRLCVDASGRSVSISQILQSARVSPYLKEYYPVIEYQGEILWVPGIRTAHSAMISEKMIKENQEKHCIRVRFQKGTFE